MADLLAGRAWANKCHGNKLVNIDASGAVLSPEVQTKVAAAATLRHRSTTSPRTRKAANISEVRDVVKTLVPRYWEPPFDHDDLPVVADRRGALDLARLPLYAEQSRLRGLHAVTSKSSGV